MCATFGRRRDTAKRDFTRRFPLAAAVQTLPGRSFLIDGD
jgi:hypothetical protein